MNALEAIKAFAEELKAKSETEFYYDVETGHTFIYRTVDTDDIDDLVKEFEATLKTNNGVKKCQKSRKSKQPITKNG